MRFTSKVAKTLRVVPAIMLLCVAGTTFAQGAADKCPADGPVNRQACLREMGAAKQAARKGGLTNPDEATLQRNALARCNVFKEPADRHACEVRVRNGSVAGSVPGGGILLRAETPVKVN
ncbi:hypothetical protein [Diaphorobacter ruginosibacter]|jgi:hypothetical protein|uniref:hypothetical protein n=1 Tax=Diaphorobacter ruginosibacter TaxID=1715720 RepID=UPI003341E347